jgi:hypothetical protein
MDALPADQQKCPVCKHEAQDLADAIATALGSQPSQLGGDLVNLKDLFFNGSKGGPGFNECLHWQQLMAPPIKAVIEKYGDHGCFGARRVSWFDVDPSAPWYKRWAVAPFGNSAHNYVEIYTKGGDFDVIVDPWPSGGEKAIDFEAAFDGGFYVRTPMTTFRPNPEKACCT